MPAKSLHTFGVRYDCAPLGKACYININNPCYYF